MAAVAILILGAACGSQAFKAGGPVATARKNPAAAHSLEVRLADLLVPFVSTAPANAGEQVKLFVRERMQDADPANQSRTLAACTNGAAFGRSVLALPSHTAGWWDSRRLA